MLKSLKAKSIAVILASAVCGSSFMVPKANAFVALASWNPPLMGLGLAITTGSVLVGGGVSGLTWWATHSQRWSIALGDIFGIPGIAGMIILDGRNSQKLAFTPITDEQAQKLGISKTEAASFNDEIDQANAIATQVNDELIRMNHPGVQDSKAAWETYRDLVSPGTFSAMQKIGAQFARMRN